MFSRFKSLIGKSYRSRISFCSLSNSLVTVQVDENNKQIRNGYMRFRVQYFGRSPLSNVWQVLWDKNDGGELEHLLLSSLIHSIWWSLVFQLVRSLLSLIRNTNMVNTIRIHACSSRWQVIESSSRRLILQDQVIKRVGYPAPYTLMRWYST